MERREQLLNGLYYVKERVDRIVNLCSQEVDLEGRFLQEKNVVDTGSAKTWIKTLSIVITLAAVIFFVWGSIMRGDFPLLIVSAVSAIVFWVNRKEAGKKRTVSAIVFAAVFIGFVVKMGSTMIIALLVFGLPLLGIFVAGMIANNKYAEAKNEQISEINEALYAQYDRLEEEINYLKNELYNNTASWYPVNYYTENAVDWFIYATKNFMGDDMMTLVQKFEETEFRAQMLAGQQQLIQEVNSGFEAMARNQEEIINNLNVVKRQLNMSNVLSTMNFCVNLTTQRKLDYQNKMINRYNMSVQENTNAVYSAQSAIKDNTYEINALRTSF